MPRRQRLGRGRDVLRTQVGFLLPRGKGAAAAPGEDSSREARALGNRDLSSFPPSLPPLSSPSASPIPLPRLFLFPREVPQEKSLLCLLCQKGRTLFSQPITSKRKWDPNDTMVIGLCRARLVQDLAAGVKPAFLYPV